MLDHTSKITPAQGAGFMRAVEAQLRQDLHNYAVELRQLVYTLPNWVVSTLSFTCRVEFLLPPTKQSPREASQP